MYRKQVRSFIKSTTGVEFFSNNEVKWAKETLIKLKTLGEFQTGVLGDGDINPIRQEPWLNAGVYVMPAMPGTPEPGSVFYSLAGKEIFIIGTPEQPIIIPATNPGIDDFKVIFNEMKNSDLPDSVKQSNIKAYEMLFAFDSIGDRPSK